MFVDGENWNRGQVKVLPKQVQLEMVTISNEKGLRSLASDTEKE